MMALIIIGLGLAAVTIVVATEDASTDTSDVEMATGQNGDDLLLGTDGFDVLLGGGGDDLLIAGLGDDLLVGGDGDDLLIAGPGADTLEGGAGNDELVSADLIVEAPLITQLQSGAERGDVVFEFSPNGETAQADQLDGGSGDDLFLFGSNDTVTGGAGDDRMTIGDWINPGSDAVITDFEPGQDVLIYSHDGPAPHLTVDEDHNGNAVLVVDGQVAVTFRDLAVGYLNESDFIFQQRRA